MAKARMAVRLAVSMILSFSSAELALAALPTPAQLLGLQPKNPAAAAYDASPPDAAPWAEGNAAPADFRAASRLID